MDKKLNFKMKVLRFTKKYKKRTTTHTLIATAILLFLLILIPAGNNILFEGQQVTANEQNTFTATFTGDLIFNDYYNKFIERNSPEKITQYVNGYLETSDYVTGNIIGPVSDKEASLLTAFNFSTVDVYDETSFDTKILANNDLLNLAAPSVNKQNMVYQQINNVKVATLGTSEHGYIDDLKRIKLAKLNADIAVVHVNWIDKYSSKVSDDQRSIAKALSDAGADFIIGHNTMVLQPIELYQDTVIMYSLGNFLHGEIYASTNDGALVQYTIGANGSSTSLTVIPLSVSDGRPQPALALSESPNRNNIYRVLTRELPDTLETIENNGVLKINLK